jgi:ribonuclease P protein component
MATALSGHVSRKYWHAHAEPWAWHPNMRLIGCADINKKCAIDADVMTDNRFPKRLRLLRPGQFERVFAARNSASNSWLVLYGAANELGHPRLGLTVSRRVGGAVQRNRWKRLLREAFRLTQHNLPNIDLVCVVRATSAPELSKLMETIFALSFRIQKRIEETACRSERNHS